jgi:hypothetical protein
MERWNMEKLSKISDLDFAVAILIERENGLTNAYAPLGVKIGETVKYLKQLSETIKEVRETAETYASIDGAHHKTYGLVKIAKRLGSKMQFPDGGIPP